MHPVLLTLPGLDVDVQAYGFFVGLGLVLGWLWAVRLARLDGLPSEPLGTAYVVAVAVGLFAARAGWLVQDTARIEGWSSFLQLQAGGLAGFFGIVVATFLSAWLAERRKVPPLAWLDAASFGLAVTLVFEKLGAWLAGTGFGRYAASGAWFSVRFPAGSPAFEHHVAELGGLLAPEATESLPVHPVQLYGLVLMLGGLVLIVVLRQRRTASGVAVLGFSGYVVVARGLVEEWFRADRQPAVMGPLNAGQVGAIVVALALLAALGFRLAAARADPRRFQPWLRAPDPSEAEKRP